MSDRFIFNISFMNVNVPTPEPHVVPVLAKDKEDAEDKLRKSLNSNINILDIEQEGEFRERKTTSQLLDRHRIMELEKQNNNLKELLAIANQKNELIIVDDAVCKSETLDDAMREKYKAWVDELIKKHETQADRDMAELKEQNKKLEEMLHNALSRICAASTFNSHTAIERLIDKETADWYWHYKSREDKK